MHFIRVAHAVVRAVVNRVRRSSGWRKVEKAAVKAHPTCAACGGVKHLQVHHKQPFHLHPQLELEPTNLIVLCMGRLECHFRLGHGGSFKAYNPTIQTDAEISLAFPRLRAQLADTAKRKRLLA